MKKIGFVFSHGHLDIEWYMPYRSFRFWTEEAIEMLMEITQKEPRFKTYILDGQVSPLEHYLCTKPHKEKELRELTENGKLSIGPFYTQFDEWLISPEAIVRNCLYGNRISKKYGNIMKAGYLPDNFGHPRQMPQILNEFGIGSLMFMRGMPDKPEGFSDEFLYEGLDGTKILCIHFSGGYGSAYKIWDKTNMELITVRTAPYNQGYLGYEGHIERITHREDEIEIIAMKMIESAKKLDERYPSGIIPLAAGCDHCPPQLQIPQIVEMANRLQDKYEFVQGNCEEMFQLIQSKGTKYPVFSEELWGSRYHSLLTGTLATRNYIKQANFTSESLLEKYAEPLSSMAAVFQKEYPSTLFDEAWKLMFFNHAHDSIHGSSVDSVHLEMIQRNEAVNQIAVGICHSALKHIGTLLNPWWNQHDKGILIFNPVDTKDLACVTDLWVPVGEQPFHLEDENGNIVPMQIIENPMESSDQRVNQSGYTWPEPYERRILIATPVTKNCIQSYAIEAGDRDYPSMSCTQEQMENEFFVVKTAKGVIDIFDKVTNQTYKGLNLLVEEADAGDAWDYSEPWISGKSFYNTEFPARSTLIESGPVRCTLMVETVMEVPKCLNGEERSSEMVKLPVKTLISLYTGIPRVDVEVEIENNASDHRIRFKAPVPFTPNKVKSQGHFGMIERPLRNVYEGDGWRQKPPQDFHFKDWVAMDNGKCGLAIACRGLYQYEAAQEGENQAALFITLLRGVGVMGRKNLKSRPNDTGSWALPIPGAQCLGKQRFEYSFIPYRCSEREDKAPFIGTANGFLYPALSHLVRSGQGPIENEAGDSLFKISPSNLVVSCLKKAYDDDSYILRFWENEGRETEAEIWISERFSKVVRSDMNEGLYEELDLIGGTMKMNVKPYKVITIRLYL